VLSASAALVEVTLELPRAASCFGCTSTLSIGDGDSCRNCGEGGKGFSGCARNDVQRQRRRPILLRSTAFSFLRNVTANR